ncbi:MAG: DNA methyltransferase [Candidatus Hermodarchaeota archaeon]
MDILNLKDFFTDLPPSSAHLRLVERHIPNYPQKDSASTSLSSTWSNLLIQGDNFHVLNALQDRFSKKIKFVYIDPPYFVGKDEIMHIPITVHRAAEQSRPAPFQELVFRNTLNTSDNVASFCSWIYPRLKLIESLIRKDGFIATRFDYHYAHYVKLLLDNIYGAENFINEFIIRRMKKNLSEKQAKNQNHVIVHSDSVFLYQLSNQSNLYAPIVKVKRKNALPIEIMDSWDNIWVDIPGYEKSKKTLYPTENSEKLLDRLIRLCSAPEEIIADFFCGSGTTVAVAERLNRKWITVDLNKYSVYETRKRLLNNGLKRPLEYYLTVTNEKTGASYINRNANYYNLILQAFGGIKFTEERPFQGRKDEAYIYIGQYDQMISKEDIQSAIQLLNQKECQAELIILGWKFQLDLPFFTSNYQKENRKIRLIRIHEDPTHSLSFRPLPFVDIDWKLIPKVRQIHLQINDYQLPVEEYAKLPNNIRTQQSIDFIDYWSVNWDSKRKKGVDWTSFRKLGPGRKIIHEIRKQTSWQYDTEGDYTILINLVDIIGNDLLFQMHVQI